MSAATGSETLIPNPDEGEGLRDIAIGLDTMRRIVAHWIEYDTESRAREGLPTTPDTHLVAPPHWPSHGSLAMWVQTLKRADAILQSLGSRRTGE